MDSQSSPHRNSTFQMRLLWHFLKTFQILSQDDEDAAFAAKSVMSQIRLIDVLQ